MGVARILSIFVDIINNILSLEGNRHWIYDVNIGWIALKSKQIDPQAR